MKHAKYFIPVILLSWLSAASAQAAIYYTSPSGSDSNTCGQASSPGTAKRNISGAAGGLRCLTAPGDKLLIATGTYNEGITSADLTVGGTAWGDATQITIQSYNGPVVLTGGGNEVINLTSTANRFTLFRGNSQDFVIDASGHQNCVGHNKSPTYIRFESIEAKNAAVDCIFAWNNWEVLYSKVHNNLGVSAQGIYVNGSNVLVKGNEIYDNTIGMQMHDGSTGSDSNDNEVTENVFRSNTLFAVATSGNRNRVHRNIGYSNGAFFAVGFNPGAGDTANADNAFYNNTNLNNASNADGEIQIGVFTAATGTIVKNNILARTSTSTNPPVKFFSSTGAVVTSNDFYQLGSISGTGGTVSGNQTCNPSFVSTVIPNPDLHLQAGSCAINAGTASITTGVTLTFIGAAPDQGAYEKGLLQTYYVSSGVNSNGVAGGSNIAVGTSASAPWQTVCFALSRMTTGDTLIVRQGEYDTATTPCTGGLKNGVTSLVPSGSSWSNPTRIQKYPGDANPIFRRYLPAGHAFTEDQYRSFHLATFAECQARQAATGHVPSYIGAYPHSCWSGGGTGVDGLDIQNSVTGAPPVNYIVDFFEIENTVEYVIFSGIDLDARGIIFNPLGLMSWAGGGKAARNLIFQDGEIRNGLKSCMSHWTDNQNDVFVTFLRMKIHSCGVPYDTNMIGGILARKHPHARFYHGWYLHAGGVSFINGESYNHAGTGLQVDGNNIVVQNSYIHDNSAGGMYASGGHNYIIENNVWYNNGEVGGPNNPNYGGHKIRNNTIVAGPLGVNATGALFNETTFGSLFENNIVDGFRQGLLNLSTQASPHAVHNNLIRTVPPGKEIVEPGTPSTKSGNLTNQDPLFAVGIAPNFAIQTGSPAKDAGRANNLTTDYLLNARPFNGTPDIGAFEFCTGGGCTTAPSTAVLTVSASNAGAGVSISYTGTSCTPASPQTTPFSLVCDINTAIVLTAPSTADTNPFSSWANCTTASGLTCNVTLAGNMGVTANYDTPGGVAVWTLTVNSTSPASGAQMTVSPVDRNELSDGLTGLTRSYVDGTTVTIVAANTAGGNSFSAWTCDQATTVTCTVAMTANRTITAAYAAPAGCGVDKPLPIGSRVQTCSGPLNVRDGPFGTVYAVTQEIGATGTIIGGPIDTGGFTWVNTNWDADDGTYTAGQAWTLRANLLIIGGTTPVETVLLTQPDHPTGATGATFTFSGSGGTGPYTFECAIDGGAYSACTSPKTYAGLSVAAHAFLVRATDSLAVVDATPEAYNWTVTATPAVLTQAGAHFYALRDGGDRKLPSESAALNAGIPVVTGGKFRVALQLESTVNDTSAQTYRLYMSHNGGAYEVVPFASFGAANVRLYGAGDKSPDVPFPGKGITSCISGSLTPVKGQIARTGGITVALPANACVVLSWIIELEGDAVANDTYDFRIYKEDGTALNSYPATPPRAVVVGERMGM